MGLAPMNTLCFSAMEHCSIAATKKAPLFRSAFRGLKRIRTAVRGFADLCLATRPSDHF